MSNKEAPDKGLILSRRTEVLALMGGKDYEWNETSQKAVVSGVKAQLELRDGKEIIVTAVLANEEAAIDQNEASLVNTSTNVDDTEQTQNTSRKRVKKQKPLKTSKRSRKQSVASNATSKKKSQNPVSFISSTTNLTDISPNHRFFASSS